MKIYQFRAKQKLPISIEEAWQFFSNPNNLGKITPDWLNFEILSPLPDKMYAGMIIEYFVRPLLNIRTTWVTEITHINEPHFFVDEQRTGPYKMWHHQHHFKEVNGILEMDDIVTYAIGFGFWGRLANKLLVSKKIKEIFEYRKTVLEKLFGNLQEVEAA